MAQNHRWHLTAFLSLFTAAAAFSQSAELVELTLVGASNAVHLEMTFSQEAPKYSIATRTEGDITIAAFTVHEATAGTKFSIPVIRPVLHAEVVPPVQAGVNPLRVLIYMEQKIAIEHQGADNIISADFSWIQAPDSKTPAVLTQINHEMNEDNSITLSFEFSESLEDERVFLSYNKRSIIGVLHNCTAEGAAVDVPNNALISSFSPQSGTSPSGVPFFKFIISSDQEVLFDKAKESQRIFLNLYGVGAGDISVVNDPPPDDELTQEYVKPSRGGAKWVYMGVGAAALIGGGVGYYYLKEDGGNPSADAIPRPEDEIRWPDNPTP